jgi:hypothetical protein
MTHDDVVLALAYAYPDVEWSYDGDGTSLDPVYGEPPVDEDGNPVGDPPLVSRGLQWHGDDDSQPTPSLAELANVLPAAQAATALAAITAERDDLIAACDWTQLGDAPLDDTAKQAWASYRQALRGFSNQKGFDPLKPPAWPTAPA